jgi:hypothetical protein
VGWAIDWLFVTFRRRRRLPGRFEVDRSTDCADILRER